MSKHTPGPWQWRPIMDGFYHELVGADDMRVHSDGSACGEYGPDIDVAGPDARLIAAAPDLLSALERINELTCFAAKENVSARLMALQQIGVATRDAIRKATGSES